MAVVERLEVEVAYARPEQQLLLLLQVPAGATVADAVRASGLCERFPEIDLERDGVGVFGRRVALGEVLRPGDRVELYRPLLADPKEARRQRAAREPLRRRGPTSAR